MTVVINGTTGITVATAAAPVFSAVSNAGQSITANTYTKVQFQTEEFDTNGNFDNATNYRFTPTVAGYYQVTASVYPSTATTLVLTALYKNGASFKAGFTGSVNSPCLVTALIYFNGTTDYVETYAYITGTTPTIAANSIYTFFQASMARSA